MDGELGLVCLTPNQRPRRATAKMRLTAALGLAKEIKDGDPDWANEELDSIAEDIASVPEYECRDGYRMAQWLENRRGWSPDAGVVEILDRYDAECAAELHKAEVRWAEENPMTPAVADGTRVETPWGPGVTSGVSAYAPFSYNVKLDREPKRDGYIGHIVPFEDTKPITSP